MHFIDMRSDTVTKPTEEMRKAMYEAEVGDDVYGEDPTVNRLEETAAEMFGKEAALFVTSGTQGNQLAVMVHTRHGEEIILEAMSHIYLYETAGIAALAGVQAHPIQGYAGRMELSQIEHAIRDHRDIHQPKTSLIALENTHNKAGGRILPLNYVQQVKALADRHQIPLHIDGARIFHAIVATQTTPQQWGEHVTTIQVCLSKGLSAPIGSLLIGTKDFIEHARFLRKRLGGGMRQAGVIAAPGLIALTKMTERLTIDHEHAKKLAIGLSQIKGLALNPDEVETNIVLVNIVGTGLHNDQFLEELKGEGVLASSFGDGIIRFVTHREITEQDVEKVLHVVNQVVRSHL